MSGRKRNFAECGATVLQLVSSRNLPGRCFDGVDARRRFELRRERGRMRVVVGDELVAADVLLEIRAQHVEERDEHRELHHERQARCQRIDFVLLIEFHQLLLLALFVLLVLFFQRVYLRSEPLHLLHRLELPEGQRHEHRADQHGEAHDRQAPAPTHDVVVDEDHDVFEQRDQRREGVLDHVGDRWHALAGLGCGLSAMGGACAARRRTSPLCAQLGPPGRVLNTR